LAGLFAYIVGAIPGIITLILGIKLTNAMGHALNISLTLEKSADSNMINMVRELAVYFKIQGIMQLIGIAVAVLVLFFMLIATVTMGISFLYI